MQQSPTRTLVLAAVASLLATGCNGAMNSGGGNNAASSSATSADGGMAATGPLRCAPSEGMLEACTGKAAGAACTLGGAQDGGWSLPGSCRSTFDGTGLACAPQPRGPPSVLVDACSGMAAGGACTATGRWGGTFTGTCEAAPASGTLFCGRAHSPPAAVSEACSGKSAGDACTRPERRDGGTQPGVCRTDGAGDLACRPASTPGETACAGLDAGATCTFGGKGEWAEALSGSCVVPASGGDASCLVSCVDLFHHRHHRGFGGRFGWGGGPEGGPWWTHGPSDAGTTFP